MNLNIGVSLILISTAYSLHGMETSNGMRIMTKNGPETLPQSFVHAVPMLKKIQQDDDQKSMNVVLADQEVRIVRLVVAHQHAITSGEKLVANTQANPGDFRACVQVAERFTLTALLEHYSKEAHDAKQ